MKKIANIKVYMTQIFFLSLFKRAFKMMKNGVYFIVVDLLVAELFKILINANQRTRDITMWTQNDVKSQKMPKFYL